MPADRGLRELEHIAEPGHAQLVPLEQPEEAEPGRVGERLQALHEGADRGGAGGQDERGSHQSIRMKG